MSKQVIENMTFTFQTPIQCSGVMENVKTKVQSMHISGVLVREGLSRNQNLYTISEMENIVQQIKGLPIFFGTMRKFDPKSGTYKSGMHANIEKHRIGEIEEGYLDKIKRLVYFYGVIRNTREHPRIIEEVRKGWGLSIGGIAHATQLVLDEAKRLLYKIGDMIVTHVQLLQPWVRTGIEGAKVEKVEVQEAMIFEPKKMDQKRIRSIVRALIKSGDIDV